MESLQIAVKDVQVDPGQPRKIYADMDGLTESIKNNGFDQFRAILIKTNPDPDGRKYQTIWGNRRTMAAEKAGVEYLWAYVVDGMSEQEIYAAQLSENEHRADLRPMERAMAFKEGLEKGISQNHMAKILAISVATLKADLELCGLHPELHQFVDTGKLPKDVARKLATSLDHPQQMHAFNNAIQGSRGSTKMLASLNAYLDKRKQTDAFALAKEIVADNGGLMKARKSSEKLEKALGNFQSVQSEVGAENMVNARKREAGKLRVMFDTLKKIAELQLATLDAFDARAAINAPKKAVAQ